MTKKNIIIDCDPGHDDVMAILLALANQDKFNILGVTTVAGNQTLERVTLNLRKLYTYLGISTPAASGAAKPIIRELTTGKEVHGETGLDGWDFPEPTFQLDSTNAMTFMYEKIMNLEDKVILVPTGPLTNIGLLFSAFPEIKEKVEAISLMGGSIYSGNYTPNAEFNIYVDPEAAKIVFNSGIPIIMSGLEVTHKAAITDEEIEKLRAMDGRISKMCGELLHFYTRYHRREGYSSYPLHDVCSIMYLLHPEIFEYKDLQVYIDTSDGPSRGKTFADLREWVKYERPNARVLLNIDRERFIDILFEGFKKLDEICK
ncbi:nucleoside hydrolase [Tepidimicrobium xylanilyticum]|uniref:Pyrimidine-specific ribonucleoside hydrolase n=1 Tax=Tepidimicrobium xylanilyticum TaxID=1123352 RepID=A0A1H2RAA5_9FIRM|nr:nucleoside hydrolase [Tepidimicrobium xylanilyticum]GMG95479.1 pyrimidine-specific ribonucleoside hydrolase RihA [Tepidimicrobium xylanilyticum]SDW16215.1 pyrimidine-specific ribonucleoside hydrolase [Tepidimicrobium xylanilyticum]